MPTHTTRLAPAIVAIVLSSVILTDPSSRAAPAAKDCLAAPNAPAPQGSHWYYWWDRAMHRKCWYLGPQGRPVRPLSSPASHPPAMPVPRPAAEPPAQPPSASAHAEATVGKDGWPELVVTRWPEPPQAYQVQSDQRQTADVTESKPALASDPSPNSDDRSSTESQDEMPLIRSTLSATELAATEPPALSTVTPERMFLLLAGALALAAIVCDAILRFRAARPVRPDRSNRRALARASRIRQPLPPLRTRS